LGGVVPHKKKKKKKTPHRGGAGNVEALVPPPLWRELRGLYRVPLRTSAKKEGSSSSGWRVITATRKKNQQEETPRVREKKRHCKHSPQKKRNGDTPLGCLGQTALRKEQCEVRLESCNICVRWAELHDSCSHGNTIYTVTMGFDRVFGDIYPW
jgi:hypothetical protein